MGGCTRYFVGFALFHQKLHFLTGFCAERIYTYKCSWENTHSSQGIIWEAKMGWFSRHPLIFWCPFLKFCNLLLHPKDKCSKSSLWTILTLHRNRDDRWPHWRTPTPSGTGTGTGTVISLQSLTSSTPIWSIKPGLIRENFRLRAFDPASDRTWVMMVSRLTATSHD